MKRFAPQTVLLSVYQSVQLYQIWNWYMKVSKVVFSAAYCCKLRFWSINKRFVLLVVLRKNLFLMLSKPIVELHAF